jgi:hypothetical protein
MSSPSVSDSEHQHATFEEDYKICIDFGTTFSTVAYICKDFDGEVDSIHTISQYSKDPLASQACRQIPSESYYPRPRPQQEEPASSLGDNSEGHMMYDSIFQLAGNAVTNDTICPGYLHGYEVQEVLGTLQLEPNSASDGNESRVSFMKLLLDEGAVTEGLRTRLTKVVDRLKQDQVISSSADVITDYLTVLLLHTRRQLEMRYGFESSNSGQ